jgi:hypothetical protein
MGSPTDVDEIFKRVQKEYDVDKLTQANIEYFLSQDGKHPVTSGRKTIAQELSVANKVYEKAADPNTAAKAQEEYVDFDSTFTLTQRNKDKIESRLASTFKSVQIRTQIEKAEKISDLPKESDLEGLQVDKSDLKTKLSEKKDELRVVIREKLDRYVERQDFSGLAKESSDLIDERIVQPEDRNVQENMIYNLAGSIMRDARDDKDIGRLEQLRSEVRGTAAAEWSGQIDKEIDKIRNQ